MSVLSISNGGVNYEHVCRESSPFCSIQLGYYRQDRTEHCTCSVPDYRNCIMHFDCVGYVPRNPVCRLLVELFPNRRRRACSWNSIVRYGGVLQRLPCCFLKQHPISQDCKRVSSFSTQKKRDSFPSFLLLFGSLITRLFLHRSQCSFRNHCRNHCRHHHRGRPWRPRQPTRAPQD